MLFCVYQSLVFSLFSMVANTLLIRPISWGWWHCAASILGTWNLKCLVMISTTDECEETSLVLPSERRTLFQKVNANGQLKGVFVFPLFLFMVFEAVKDDLGVFVEFAVPPFWKVRTGGSYDSSLMTYLWELIYAYIPPNWIWRGIVIAYHSPLCESLSHRIRTGIFTNSWFLWRSCG